MRPRHTPWAQAAADFAIGLRPIAEEDWFEGGEAEASRKVALLASEPAFVWGETDGSRPAQAEVLVLVEQALGVRAAAGPPPLWVASLMVADDLCLMERGDGDWRLTAISLCSPTFFTAAESLGKSLAELHGPVPGFGGRLLPRVMRIFDNLPADTILERRNWTVVNAAEAYLPASAPVRARIGQIDSAQAGEALYLRVERQTIRALPSGGVVFTIRAWRDPLSVLRDQPGRLAAFAQAWRTATPAFRAYKGFGQYDALVEAFLARAP